jgi:hypothetical protein
MDSIAAIYQIVLTDQTGEEVAIFDNFISIDIKHTLNDEGTFSVEFYDDDDDRLDLFELDGQVIIRRTVPGCDLDWYTEFGGFYRSMEKTMNDDGRKTLVVSGSDYNELLRRKIIAYKEGTIRADKNAPAETCMKEYVEENLGPTADDTVVGRLYQGGFPNFTVEADDGKGETWSGSRAFENVLDVLKEIANFSGIDFKVISSGEASFVFMTYEDQMGEDRTDEEIGNEGLNKYGNAPVIFNVGLGNIAETQYIMDRTAEANVAVVLGSGEGSTRYTVTVSNETAVDQSPWNIREMMVTPGNIDQDFETYELTTRGNEALQEHKGIESFNLTPLQRPSTLYGKHYFLGDRVVVRYGETKLKKKIVSVSIKVSDNGKESIDIEFADIPLVR